MKIVVQNLQKRSGLAGKLVDQYEPDLFLAQEINLPSEKSTYHFDKASYTSSLGFGTAVYARDSSKLSNVRRVKSPHAEFGGSIHKKTTIVDYDGIQCVSFHGFNGTPFRSIDKLLDHVRAVLKVVQPGAPAIFAGDFNTWTSDYVEAVQKELETAGFVLVYSWKYPGKDFMLDHAFLRGMTLLSATCFASESDHDGALLQVELSSSE